MLLYLKTKIQINLKNERVNQLKELALGERMPDPIDYGPDKVAKAMAIAVKSDGQFSKAVREIEKIGKDLSKVSTIARALKTAKKVLLYLKIKIQNNLKNMCQDYLIKIKRHTINI